MFAYLQYINNRQLEMYLSQGHKYAYNKNERQLKITIRHKRLCMYSRSGNFVKLGNRLTD